MVVVRKVFVLFLLCEIFSCPTLWDESKIRQEERRALMRTHTTGQVTLFSSIAQVEQPCKLLFPSPPQNHPRALSKLSWPKLRRVSGSSHLICSQRCIYRRTLTAYFL